MTKTEVYETCQCEHCRAQRDAPLLAELSRLSAENARLKVAISDAHRWELERLLERVRRDDPGNFPLIQAIEAALRAERDPA